MASANKTTMGTGKAFTAQSKSGVRPATSGNKNVNSRRDSKGAQVPTGMIGRTHKGPDLGNG